MKKVLVLEDEPNIRSFVVINLKRAGYETIEAGDRGRGAGADPEEPGREGGPAGHHAARRYGRL